MAALEPAEAALPRRVERGGYSEVDVRKALSQTARSSRTSRRAGKGIHVPPTPSHLLLCHETN